MKNIYEAILKPILTNQIVVTWIAPIITGLIVLAVPAIVTKFIKGRKLLKEIKEVNNKIINTIRPFIIQRIKINSYFISDLRMAVIKENKVKEKYIFNETEIRNKILLDISETRFLKETEKQDLISFTYERFKDFDEKQKLIHTNYEEIEERKEGIISIISISAVLIVSLIIMLIAYKIKPVGNNIEDNIVILITMISSILSLLILYKNYLGLKDYSDKCILNLTSNIEDGIYKKINSITKFIKKEK